MSKIYDTVIRIITEKASEIDVTKLTNEAHLFNDLGIDSLTAVEIIMEIENEFMIDIRDDEAQNLTTIGSIVAFIEVKQYNSYWWQGDGAPHDPIIIENIPMHYERPKDSPFNNFFFKNWSIDRPGLEVGLEIGSNDKILDKRPPLPPAPDDCEDPLKPHYLTCDQWLLMNGHGFLQWIQQQQSFKVYKPQSWLDSEAVSKGLTSFGYIQDRVSWIISSMDNTQVKNLGQAVRKLGYLGTALNSYKLIVAVGDGNITKSDVLSAVSFGLGIITFIPGVGTAIGLGGTVLLATGSFVFGLASDHVDDSTLIDFSSR